MNRFALAAMGLLLAACHKEEAPHAIADSPLDASASTNAIDDASITDAMTSTSADADVIVDASIVDAEAASATSSARIPCGRTTCGPKQYCLHYDPGAGGADLPNKWHGDATMCSNVVLHTGSMKCRPPNAERQCACSALIPRAPPNGNGSGPE